MWSNLKWAYIRKKKISRTGPDHAYGPGLRILAPDFKCVFFTTFPSFVIFNTWFCHRNQPCETRKHTKNIRNFRFRRLKPVRFDIKKEMFLGGVFCSSLTREKQSAQRHMRDPKTYIRMGHSWKQVAYGGSGAKAPPLATPQNGSRVSLFPYWPHHHHINTS